MSNLAFVTHPSVRIKGSENVYSPVQCLEELCSIKTPHWHCPFCVKTDSYTDPVILKAHYRVKHVDKGIEFAGLKILRCCDQCDIVGVIKGEKKFKGAHWHCYRCRNGFNRRDEAIKHYKTHFRNPQTTFQISITQDLNSPVSYQSSSRPSQPSSISLQEVETSTVLDHTQPSHSTLTQAVSASHQDVVSSNSLTLSNGKIHDGTVQVSISSSQPALEMDEDNEAIVIIQEEPLESEEIDTTFSHQVITTEPAASVGKEEEKDEKGLNTVRRLQQEKASLKREISLLHKHIEKQEELLKAGGRREEELLRRLGRANQGSVTGLLKRMEEEHRQLLRQQLDTLQQALLTARTTPAPTVLLTDQHGQEIQVVNASSLEDFLSQNVSSTSNAGQTTLPSTTIIQANELSLEHVNSEEVNTQAVECGVPVSLSGDLGTSYVMCVQNVKLEEDDANTVEVPSATVSDPPNNDTASSPQEPPLAKRPKVD